MIERVLNDFDIDQIANSGQCFRFHRVGDKSYNLIAGTHLLNIQQNGRTVRFDCDEDEFNAIWRPYFDLDADYGRWQSRSCQTRYLSAERRCIRRRTAYSAAGPVGDYSMLYHLPAEQYRADYQVCRKFVFPFRGNLL